MKRHILIDKLQLIDALGTLNIENNMVDIRDVLGVINCCNSFLTDVKVETITPIASRSENRRLEMQIKN